MEHSTEGTAAVFFFVSKVVFILIMSQCSSSLCAQPCGVCV